MKGRIVAGAAWAVLLGASPWAGASGAAGASSALVHKQRFVEQLLSDSPMVRRIENSGNAQALAYLNNALAQRKLAGERLSAGANADAERALNEAILNVGRARQLVPEDVNRAVFERVRLARLMTGVDSLRANYERTLRQGRASTSSTLPEDPELERIDALIQDAHGLASAEKLTDAMRALENAEHGLLVALNRVLGSKTLRYAERFDTPAEEYAYEVQRNASYVELVPVAIHEYRPDAEALRQMNRLVDRNRAHRHQAEELAARRDWRGALRAVRAGTADVQRALSVAGLQVPREGDEGKSD